VIPTTPRSSPRIRRLYQRLEAPTAEEPRIPMARQARIRLFVAETNSRGSILTDMGMRQSERLEKDALGDLRVVRRERQIISVRHLLQIGTTPSWLARAGRVWLREDVEDRRRVDVVTKAE
jgi:hypothetical protein